MPKKKPIDPAVSGANGGAIGGLSRSKAKVAASRENGLLGGRPKGPNGCTAYPSHRFSKKTGRCYGCGFQRPE